MTVPVSLRTMVLNVANATRDLAVMAAACRK